jgi:hypothetical protein
MDDQIKKDEMGMTHSTQLEKTELHKNFEEN